MSRKWKDQPDVVDKCVQLLSTFLGELGVQVLKKPNTGDVYVTIGTLFHSQTVELLHSEDVWNVLQAINDTPSGQPVDLDGIEHVKMSNRDEEAA